MNSIELATKFIPMLDETYRLACLTSVLDGAPELVREGANANELIIPKMELTGLANYDRNTGYVMGDVYLESETVQCDYDRGRMFSVDNLDNAESAGIAFGRLAGEFIRTKVAPELDAYRLSNYARFAMYDESEKLAKGVAKLESGEDVVKELRVAHAAMDEAEVPADGRILFITSPLKGMVDDMDTYRSRAALNLASQIVVVPQTRFYTEIELINGGYIRQREDEEAGMNAGKDINFMLIHKSAVIQFQKHVVPKVIAPEQNQDADAWRFGYRTVGVARVYENKAAGIYCNYLDA